MNLIIINLITIHHLRCGFSLASWKWHHVEAYIIVTLFIVLSGLCKLVFHQLHWLSSRSRYSCSLPPPPLAILQVRI